MPFLDRDIRVLIVDDDEDDFFITSEYIRQIENGKFVLAWCSLYQEALRKIADRQFDIYLVDYRLGAKTGLDLLKEAVALHCEEPIVLLTGKGNQKIDREAMKVGAFDYLTKSELNTEKLERCIRYSLERSASLRALRAGELKYRTVFEKSKDAIFIADKELRFKDLNQATSELLGYNKEQLIQFNLYELLVSNDMKQRISDLMGEHGEIMDEEIVLRSGDNENKVCILSMSLQHDNKNNVYVQGIIHDITNLKKAEKITLQAEKLAAAGRLVRTLAHEVRNPLSNIQMSVEQLETLHFTEDDRVFLEIIQRNSKRINGLITELLDSSRPAEMNYESVSLQNILDASLKLADDRMTLKQVDLATTYPEQDCLIYADSEKLKIAFLNIIINAIEAITSGNGKITVVIIEKAQYFMVEITDNGCGISPDHLSRLFEPYFTSKRNGMGLGLASALNIIQAHQGNVDVRSQVQEGTIFSITFPKATLNSPKISFEKISSI